MREGGKGGWGAKQKTMKMGEWGRRGLVEEKGWGGGGQRYEAENRDQK